MIKWDTDKTENWIHDTQIKPVGLEWSSQLKNNLSIETSANIFRNRSDTFTLITKLMNYMKREGTDETFITIMFADEL